MSAAKTFARYLAAFYAATCLATAWKLLSNPRNEYNATLRVKGNNFARWELVASDHAFRREVTAPFISVRVRVRMKFANSSREKFYRTMYRSFIFDRLSIRSFAIFQSTSEGWRSNAKNQIKLLVDVREHFNLHRTPRRWLAARYNVTKRLPKPRYSRNYVEKHL